MQKPVEKETIVSRQVSCYDKTKMGDKSLMKIMCINISSRQPKKLVKFYELIGISVFVDDDCFDGFHFGNAKMK